MTLLLTGSDSTKTDMTVATISVEERFWKFVNKNGPVHPTLGTRCWEWTGEKSSKGGYGRFRIDGKLAVRAHRYSFFLANGIQAEPMCLHACDNPPCVNPYHLFAGTAMDNHLDKVAKGRAGMSSRYGHPLTLSTTCRHGHEYTPENTKWRRVGRPGQRPWRRCVACKRQNDTKRWEKVKAQRT